jgi:antitoxin component of MazEF toxin-antitoxin module
MKLRIEKIGDSTVLVLPDELLAELNLQPGQWVEVAELPGGGFRLIPAADAGEVSAIVDDLLVEYRETFKKLAGS